LPVALWTFRGIDQPMESDAGRYSRLMVECNLKAVALKAVKSRNRPCEKDSQGTAAGRFGEEYAPPSGGA
jgi:hypothetical protein